MIAVIVILIVIIILLLIVSALFFKGVLAGRPDRKERMEGPLLCLDKSDGNPLREQFIENRTKLRAQGAEFDKTMTPVTIVNKDGMTLHGRYRLTENENHNWVISVHGYKDDHRFMLPYVMKFFESGYNVFTQDNRAHGLSDGKFISMGWHDKDDVYEWLDTIVKMDPDARILVHGISMGGATTMMLAGLNHPSVVGYIEDCGYTTVFDIFKTVINRDYHLPAFPIVHVCSLITRIILKYDYKKSSSLAQLAKCDKPILFIHGEKDGFVPLWMGQKCYEEYTGPKDMYIAKEAGHAESMDWYPEEYFKEVFDFVAEFCS